MALINDPINAAFSFFFPRKWHPRQLSRQTQSPNFVTNRLGDQKGHSLKRWLSQVWSFFQHVSSCMFPLFNNIVTRKALLVERGEISYCRQSVEISLFFLTHVVFFYRTWPFVWIHWRLWTYSSCHKNPASLGTWRTAQPESLKIHPLHL